MKESGKELQEKLEKVVPEAIKLIEDKIGHPSQIKIEYADEAGTGRDFCNENLGLDDRAYKLVPFCDYREGPYYGCTITETAIMEHDFSEDSINQIYAAIEKAAGKYSSKTAIRAELLKIESSLQDLLGRHRIIVDSSTIGLETVRNENGSAYNPLAYIFPLTLKETEELRNDS